MQALLDANDLVLMEAAVVERLRRDSGLSLPPALVHAPLVYEDDGRRAMRLIFEEYLTVAETAGLPLLLCTPTWRANHERVAAAGMTDRINADAVRFVREIRDGRLLDGTAPGEAIARIDAATGAAATGYMVNCAHPSFLAPQRLDGPALARFVGVQANASSLDHAELDGAAVHHADDVAEWASQLLALNRDYGVTVLGGCCGTTLEHLAAIAAGYAGS